MVFFIRPRKIVLKSNCKIHYLLSSKKYQNFHPETTTKYIKTHFILASNIFLPDNFKFQIIFD